MKLLELIKEYLRIQIMSGGEVGLKEPDEDSCCDYRVPWQQQNNTK